MIQIPVNINSEIEFTADEGTAALCRRGTIVQLFRRPAVVTSVTHKPGEPGMFIVKAMLQPVLAEHA